MTRRQERFEIEIRATPAQVWERLTTSEGLASWFGTRAWIDLRLGGDRTLGWGDEAEMTATVSEFQPGRSLRIVYLADGEEVGAEQWLITSEAGTVRLTLIHSLPDIDTDGDWDEFYGDFRRGWQLFMASMRFGLEQAVTPDRQAGCRYIPAPIPAQQIWDLTEAALQGAGLVAGMEPALLIPPHSRLLVAPDRTLLLDVEGASDSRVLYVQAATHGGPGAWRADVLRLVTSAVEAAQSEP